MKVILPIVPLVLLGCATTFPNTKNDDYGSWNWRDQGGHYLLNWKVEKDSNSFMDSVIFDKRARGLCGESEPISIRFMGRNESSGDNLVPAGNGVYVPVQTQKTYVGGTVRCASNDKHVKDLEHYRWMRGESDG